MSCNSMKAKIISATLVGAMMIGGFGFAKMASADDTAPAYVEITPESFGVFQYDTKEGDGNISEANGDIQLSGRDIQNLVINQKAIDSKITSIDAQVDKFEELNKQLSDKYASATENRSKNNVINGTTYARGATDDADYYSRYASATSDVSGRTLNTLGKNVTYTRPAGDYKDYYADYKKYETLFSDANMRTTTFNPNGGTGGAAAKRYAIGATITAPAAAVKAATTSTRAETKTETNASGYTGAGSGYVAGTASNSGYNTKRTGTRTVTDTTTYIFTGWYKGDTGLAAGAKTTQDGSDVTYYAKYSSNTTSNDPAWTWTYSDWHSTYVAPAPAVTQSTVAAILGNSTTYHTIDGNWYLAGDSRRIVGGYYIYRDDGGDRYCDLNFDDGTYDGYDGSTPVYSAPNQ